MLDALRDTVVDMREECERVQDDRLLSRLLDRISADLTADFEHIEIGRLQVHLRGLLAQAAAHDDPFRQADKAIRGGLNQISEALQDLLSQSLAVAQMEASRIAIGLIDSDHDQVRKGLKAFRDVAANADNVDSSVIAALDQGDEELPELDALAAPFGPPPAYLQKVVSQRAAVLGQKAVATWNVSIAVIKQGSKELGGRAWTGVGNGVEKTAEGAVGVSFAALAVHLGVPLEMIGMLIPSFLSAKNEVKKLEDKTKGAAAKP